MPRDSLYYLRLLPHNQEAPIPGITHFADQKRPFSRRRFDSEDVIVDISLVHPVAKVLSSQ